MRTRRAIRISCYVLCALFVFSSAMAKAEGDLNGVAAQSAVLLEMNTGKILCEKNANARLPMASTTKIMTAILAIEYCALDEIVEVTREAYGTEGSSMYLELGEKLEMEDLLYGLMLSSGNDAAMAIAIHIGGSKEGFADVMNEKAAELGLKDTHFVTPNGLHDPKHYTTAYELALISAYAMKNDTFRTIVGTKSYTTHSGNKVRNLRNKNKTLYLYEGGNGVKTGYTSAAGRCLSFGAEQNGMQLIGVVLHSGDTYGDAFSLLNYGFSHYEMRNVARSGEVLEYTRLNGAQKNVLALCASKDIMISVEINGDFEIKTQLILEDKLEAPVEKGETCGTIQFWENGRMLDECALLAGETILRKNTFDYFKRCAQDWCA